MKKFLSSLFRLPAEKCMEVVLEEDAVFTCQLLLPVMPAKEVAEAIRWELPLHVPYEEGSYHYAYQLLDKNDGMQQVEVYIIRKELVAQYDEQAKSKGLVLTALRLEDEGKDLNLLPDAKKRTRQPLKKLYELGTVVTCGLGVLLLAGAWCYREVQLGNLVAVETKLKGLQIWQERYEEQRIRRNKIEVLANALHKLERERLVWNEVLFVLGSSMPKECWLTNVKQMEASKFMEVQGKASSMEQVQELLANLKTSEKFQEVSLLETGVTKDALLSYKLRLQGRR